MEELEFKIEDGVLLNYLGKSKHVKIPEGVTEIGNRAFYNNKYIESIEISKTVYRIGARSLSCLGDKFIEITIPENVKTIDYLAFDCDEIRRVYILNPDIFIHQEAFDHCYELTDIYFNGTKEQFNSAILMVEDDETPYLIGVSGVNIHYKGEW